MGGVIAQNTDVMPDLLRYLNISRDRFIQYGKKYWKDLQTNKISEEQFWKNFSSSYGAPVPGDLWARYFDPVLDKKMIALIHCLREQNRVVCGTNTIDSHYSIHENRGDYGNFHAVYASNRIKIAKPDAVFFRFILEAEKCLPEETIFIDDMPENVKAAESLGIGGLLFSGYQSLCEQL